LAYSVGVTYIAVIRMPYSVKRFSLKLENSFLVFCLSVVIKSKPMSLVDVYSSRATDPNTTISTRLSSIFEYFIEISGNISFL